MSYSASGPLEVSGCPLNREVMDLFRILVDSTLTFKISANGCNLTGTLADPSSFRQGNCSNRLATDWMNEDADRKGGLDYVAAVLYPNMLFDTA